MYAVVRTGGKQYKVQAGDVLNIEKLSGEVGQTVELDEVLLVSNEGDVKVGRPLVDGAKVSAEIVRQNKAPKVTIFKKIRRHGKQLTKGHRQLITAIRVTDIQA